MIVRESAYKQGFIVGRRGREERRPNAVQREEGLSSEQVVEYLNGVEDGRRSRPFHKMPPKRK